MERDRTLDLMKGVAIVAMIVGHLGWRGPEYKWIFSFHMPLFFIISGFLHGRISLSGESVAKQFKRLVLPYVVSACAIGAGYLFLSMFAEAADERGLSYWVKAVFWGAGIGHHHSPMLADVPCIGAIWFLLAMFWCRLMFNLLAMISTRPGVLAAASVAVSVVCIAVHHRVVNLPLSILPGGSALVFYTAGYLLRLYDGFSRISLPVAAVLLVIWVVATYLSPYTLQVVGCSYPVYPLSVAGAIAATGVIYFCCKKLLSLRLRALDVVVWLGEVSLVILCLHDFDLMVPVRERLGITMPLTSIVYDLTFCTLGTVLLSQFAATRKIFKLKKNSDNPLKAWLFRGK